MRYIAPAALVVLALASFPAAGDESGFNPSAHIKPLARCAALYQYLADAYETSEPATAEYLSGLGNGAYVAVMYLLAADDANHSRELKAYATHADSLIESNAMHLASLFELAPAETLEAEMGACAEANKVQTAVVEAVRAELESP